MSQFNQGIVLKMGEKADKLTGEIIPYADLALVEKNDDSETTCIRVNGVKGKFNLLDTVFWSIQRRDGISEKGRKWTMYHFVADMTYALQHINGGAGKQEPAAAGKK